VCLLECGRRVLVHRLSGCEFEGILLVLRELTDSLVHDSRPSGLRGLEGYIVDAQFYLVLLSRSCFLGLNVVHDVVHLFVCVEMVSRLGSVSEVHILQFA
jgi:hypothetical protein